MDRVSGQVQPLPLKYEEIEEPVLGVVIVEWKEWLLDAERVAEVKSKKWDAQKSEETFSYM